MRKTILTILLSSLIIMVCTGNLFAAEYDHEASSRGITMSWKVDGANLHVKLKARTTGWVAVGFNPTDQMKGADFIMGYVDEGKVEIKDEYGDEQRNHSEDEKLGGTSDVTVVGGEEKDGSTTIEFTIPLNSGDKYDSVINPDGETIVLLAYGGRRDSFMPKHKFRTALKVNLASGKVE